MMMNNLPLFSQEWREVDDDSVIGQLNSILSPCWRKVLQNVSYLSALVRLLFNCSLILFNSIVWISYDVFREVHELGRILILNILCLLSLQVDVFRFDKHISWNGVNIYKWYLLWNVHYQNTSDWVYLENMLLSKIFLVDCKFWYVSLCFISLQCKSKVSNIL